MYAYEPFEAEIVVSSNFQGRLRVL